MTKKLIFCMALLATTPVVALTPSEEAILKKALQSDNYTVNFEELCKSKTGQGEAENVYNELDLTLTNMMASIEKSKAYFSHRHNDFETNVYDVLLKAYDHLTKAEKDLSDNKFKYCEE